MSVFSRALVAGVVCAGLSAQAFAAPTADDPGSTGGRLAHASKCVLTFGLTSGCDKDEAGAKRVQREDAAAKADPKVAQAKVADEQSTRHQFMNAGKCVVSFGFAGNCDKSDPDGSAKAAGASARAEREPAPPDNSTAGQFKRAGACVLTFGFLGDCDKK